MNPGTLLQISRDNQTTLFQVHSCQEYTCDIFPVGHPDQVSRLILIENTWQVEGAEEIPYQIQILSSQLDDLFLLKQILLHLEVNDIRNLCLASPDFNRVGASRDFWEDYYRHRSIQQAPANYPTPVEFYIQDFLAKKAESEKWTNSTRLLRDLGMPELDLQQYLKDNVYPSWLEQVQAEHASNPVKNYSVFESYEQGAGYYQARSELEAGLLYLIESGFDGLYDEIYTLLEQNPAMTLGEALRDIEHEIVASTEKIDLEEEDE